MEWQLKSQASNLICVCRWFFFIWNCTPVKWGLLVPITGQKGGGLKKNIGVVRLNSALSASLRFLTDIGTVTEPVQYIWLFVLDLNFSPQSSALGGDDPH